MGEPWGSPYCMVASGLNEICRFLLFSLLFYLLVVSVKPWLSGLDSCEDGAPLVPGSKSSWI
jgi:hypothetical protein